MQRTIILIAHNLRSCHNAGSLLRTAEGLGIHKVYLTGYTPYPQRNGDTRMPHLSQKIDKQIAKTALGAEKTQAWQDNPSIDAVIAELRLDGYTIIGLEQTADSLPLPAFASPSKLALIVGREVEGIEPAVLGLCDAVIEIPMFGAKESFNVVQAAAMTLYEFRFH